MTTEPRTPDPVVALGEAILVSAWGYNFEPPDAARIGVDLAPKVLAALTEAGWSLTRNDGLDAAWAAAEAALPEGWHIGRLLRTAPAFPEQWFVEAQRSGGPNRNYETMKPLSTGPTPAAALQALATRLRATTEAPE